MMGLTVTSDQLRSETFTKNLYNLEQGCPKFKAWAAFVSPVGSQYKVNFVRKFRLKL